ncbi:MAG: hypothetical protein COA42_06590 [Alteromonadaceae bacterium]|nr:MAG: hypothetical protein COA42_06590 [Alteromonadaceae bacterium]
MRFFRHDIVVLDKILGSLMTKVMTNVTLALEKYLRDYAEPEAQSLDLACSVDEKSYQRCIVIPACDEAPDFLEQFKRPELMGGCLLILVVNQADVSVGVLPRNHHLFESVLQSGSVIYRHLTCTLVRTAACDILLVNRYQTGSEIPVKQGVGLARKIGCDLACALFVAKRLTSSWVYSTDADAVLPEAYFRHRVQSESISAEIFEFHHQDDGSDVAQATQLYESAIKYYRQGLAWAGSAYAVYTLGSTLVFNISAYCQVRGFPKRAGAEDFYLINKLAKISPLSFNPLIDVALQSRVSERVPFGTGPAIKNILELECPGEEYTYYNPQVFIALKQWLHFLAVDFKKVFFSDNNSIDCLLEQCKSLAPELLAAAEHIGFNSWLKHLLKQCRNPESYDKNTHHWFDAFQTLKFIRYLQANYYPPQALKKCLRHAGECFV